MSVTAIQQGSAIANIQTWRQSPGITSVIGIQITCQVAGTFWGYMAYIGDVDLGNLFW